jgi:hypothetical protein
MLGIDGCCFCILISQVYQTYWMQAWLETREVAFDTISLRGLCDGVRFAISVTMYIHISFSNLIFPPGSALQRLCLACPCFVKQ